MPEKKLHAFHIEGKYVTKNVEKQIYTSSDMKNYSPGQCTLNGINIMMTHNQI